MNQNQNQDKTDFNHNSDPHNEVLGLTAHPIDSGDPHPLELEDVDAVSAAGNNIAIASAYTHERIHDAQGQSTPVPEVQISSIQTDHVDFAANAYPATDEVGSDTSSEGLLGSGRASPLIPVQDKPSDRELQQLFPELDDPLIGPWSPQPTYPSLIGPAAVGLDDSIRTERPSSIHLQVPRGRTESRKAHGPYSPGASRSSSHSRSNSGSGSEASTVGSYIARRRHARRESRRRSRGSIGDELMTVGALGETLPAFKTIAFSIQFCPIFNVDTIQKTLTIAEYKCCLKTDSNIAADQDLYTSVLEVTRQIWNQHQPTADVNGLSEAEEVRAAQELALSRFRAWRRATRSANDESSTHGEAYSPASVADDQATRSFLHKMAKLEQEVVGMVGGRLRESRHWDDTEIIVTRQEPIYLFRDQTEAESVNASIRGIDLKGNAFELAPNEIGDLNLDYPSVALESGTDPRRRGSVPLIWSSVASSEGVDPQLLMADPDALDPWAHEPTQI